MAYKDILDETQQDKPIDPNEAVLKTADQMLGRNGTKTPTAPAANPLELADQMLKAPGTAAPSEPPAMAEQMLADGNDKQKELDQLLSDFKYEIEDGYKGIGNRSPEDAAMKHQLLERVQTGLELGKQRPGQGMDIDSALSILNAVKPTGSVRRLNTNSVPDALAAQMLGLPKEIKDKRYDLRDVWGGVTEETSKQKMQLDEILHPEKFQDKPEEITLPDGRKVQGMRDQKNGGFRVIPDERDTNYSTPNGIFNVKTGSILPGTEPKEKNVSVGIKEFPAGWIYTDDAGKEHQFTKDKWSFKDGQLIPKEGGEDLSGLATALNSATGKKPVSKDGTITDAASSYIMIQAPDGSKKAVPADKADGYIAKGGKRI